ncbi:WD40-repeat-containing domain protein [Butyriboletus roseoflavus]|nr:WD40-repeat-containing domain protein [Butyriboletus roseoflavus]
MTVVAVSVSRDHKWVACGTYQSGASVWDTELREKVIDVEGTKSVFAVDFSPDSTRFATGIYKEASVWSISSGERLVGPVKHDGTVTGMKFSPNGEQIATTSYGGSIRVFDSRTGDEVININTTTPSQGTITPLSWSNDGQQIFAVCKGNKIRSFEVSTGSQLTEIEIRKDGRLESIALATNGKFLAAYAGCTVSFLDTSTLSQIDPVVKDSERICSIALSPDCNYLATGRKDGKISVCTLGHILPDLYGPFHVCIWPAFCLPC